MYLLKLVNESAVRNEIESNEPFVNAEFKNSFSFEEIYNNIFENLEAFVSDDLLSSYSNIKDYGTQYALNYLHSKSKEIASRG